MFFSKDCQQVSFQPLYRYIAIFAGGQFQQPISPFPAIRSNSDSPLFSPHVIMPLNSNKRDIGQRSAKIIASRLHYFMISVDNGHHASLNNAS